MDVTGMSRPAGPERSKSVDRAVELLRVLAVHGPLRLADIDDRLDGSRRSLQRLVTSLEHGGLVSRDPGTRLYDLGMGLAVFGTIAAERIDLPKVAPPYVRSVRDATGQTGLLLVRQDDAAVCAHLEVVPDGPALILPLGRLVPLWSGAVRSILAYLDLAAVPTIPEHTRAGLTTRLATVRAQGWEVGRAEVLPGAIAVAAPVFDPMGKPIACLGALGYQANLDVDECVAPVCTAAKELTRALGGRAPTTDAGLPVA